MTNLSYSTRQPISFPDVLLDREQLRRVGVRDLSKFLDVAVLRSAEGPATLVVRPLEYCAELASTLKEIQGYLPMVVDLSRLRSADDKIRSAIYAMLGKAPEPVVFVAPPAGSALAKSLSVHGISHVSSFFTSLQGALHSLGISSAVIDTELRDHIVELTNVRRSQVRTLDQLFTDVRDAERYSYGELKDPEIKVSMEVRNQLNLFSVSGELPEEDKADRDLRKSLNNFLLQAKTNNLPAVVSLKGATHIGATALGQLIKLKKDLAHAGLAFKLCEASPEVYKRFRGSGLTQYIFPDLQLRLEDLEF